MIYTVILLCFIASTVKAVKTISGLTCEAAIAISCDKCKER